MPVTTSNAPEAIGSYSQAIRAGNTIYLSGQIPLIPETMEIVSKDFREQLHQVIKNLQTVADAAGGSFNDIVKLTVYLTDLKNFPLVNEIMPEYFTIPYPARVAIGVSQLPKEALVEIDAVLYLGD
ncbi:MAG: RidA family protein [Gammaproteobacteria bacterium]|nr:RidA family protein [Gammaproteobacteria bacterium]